MKKVKINIMKVILKMSIACFFLFCFGLVSAWGQNGQVPPLVSVQDAKKIMLQEVQLLSEAISTIEQSGGTVDQSLKDRFELYKAVNEVLQSNTSGLTTFAAIAGNSNLKLLTTDDQAYKDLLDGNWDENISELIKILTL
jgi:hypothetical protein